MKKFDITTIDKIYSQLDEDISHIRNKKNARKKAYDLKKTTIKQIINDTPIIDLNTYLILEEYLNKMCIIVPKDKIPSKQTKLNRG